MTPVAPGCPPVDVTVTDVTILGEVEIKNDVGNPVPVSLEGCVGIEACDGVPLPVDVQNSSIEISNDAGNPVPVTFTPAASVDRPLDGGFQNGAGTIVIPDGVIEFGVTVLAGGDDPSSTADWVTINSPDFAGAVPLKNGQSVSHTADPGNHLNGPITITVPAGAAANATWVKP